MTISKGWSAARASGARISENTDIKPTVRFMSLSNFSIAAVSHASGPSGYQEESTKQTPTIPMRKSVRENREQLSSRSSENRQPHRRQQRYDRRMDSSARLGSRPVRCETTD